MKVDYTKYFPALGAQKDFGRHPGQEDVLAHFHLIHSPAFISQKGQKVHLPSAAQGETQTHTLSNLFHLPACPKYPVPSWDGSLFLNSRELRGSA